MWKLKVLENLKSISPKTNKIFHPILPKSFKAVYLLKMVFGNLLTVSSVVL